MMGQPLRILHAHSGNMFGGVEMILLTLARERGWAPGMEMEFALCFEDRLSAELKDTGAAVHPLCPVRVRRPWTVLRARRALAALLRRRPFDLIVVHSAWTHALFAPVARRAKRPLVWWLHGHARGTHWTERWARLTRPDLLLCVSRSVAACVPNLFRDVAHEVVYAPFSFRHQAVGPEARREVRAELGIPADAVVILQVSRMEPGKGHAVHLKALGGLLDLPGWCCCQVGGPNSEAEARYFAGLQRMAHDLGLGPRVRFLGKRADVPRLLRAADLFCQPNVETEGFSIAFLEALAAGLPVLTTPLGGAAEQIDDACGVLLPPGDSEALARCLRRFLTDPAHRERAGEAGRRRVEALCDPARQMPRLEELFRRVAGTVREPAAPAPRHGRSEEVRA
jgi:glycosyltransferase involved in cell wall biosynthesis